LVHPPKRIILGAKVPDMEKELVMSIAGDLHIAVYQASLVWNEFALEFKQVQ
jgi:hypothetical protein